MDVLDLISRFAVALGIGLLIGLERGWRTRELEPGRRAAGIRTFAITGLLGGTTGALAMALGGAASAGGGIVVAIGFASYAAVLGLFTLEENSAGGSYSATSTIAGMLTFALSAYAVIGDMRLRPLPRWRPQACWRFASSSTAGSEASPGRSCARDWCCSR